ncbi:MAG: 50S ribosomal protein L15 [Pseudomonadales bacterium]|nr:50S ribosomal protein L15 [Pseudomonadales bacterium]MDP7597621.1 50S ribosomal protein L15 [Pseudomonadales bacterium]HJN51765.1 50S ribosomal protein L15 [Pseudomonadales bacterium]
MRLNTLSPQSGSKPSRKRVGRGMGGGNGKTCGRGNKGQKSRSGGKIRIGFEGGQMPLQRRLPKFGFTSAKAHLTGEVRLSELEKVEQDVIDIAVLKANKILPKRVKIARVICSGEITKAVTLKGIAVTRGARTAIEAAGGTIEA